LKHVSFRYSPTTPLVVEDISFRIEPGQRVAITGPTGSGKSTIARLLSGLYEPESGAVLFDGVDLRSLDRRWIRSQLGIVTQDVQLFTGTIRSNIALADSDLPFDDIVFAATVACIHDDIMRMPLGYETQVVDRGLSLSGGQRQRLAIARAIARRPRMLILDEATSHLDTLTQDRLKRNLAALACTQILIAHRLSTIRDADVIIVIEDGRTAANGSHAALLAQGGTYAALAGS
jgi:ATP-binding cassette, subfamily B, bacterial